MPVPTTSAAKGYHMVAAEYGTSVGLFSLLTDTAVASLPGTLTTAIPAAATYGMRLAIGVYDHTAVGTITVTGTAPFSTAAVNETSTSIPLLEKPGEIAWYVTKTAFANVNASGVTLGSGLTGGRIVIFGIQAAHRLVPGMFKLTDKYKEHSPPQMRGIYDLDINLIPLQKDDEWELELEGYPDSALMLLLGGYNAAPTVATIPAAPLSILASTSVVTASSASAAAQPTAPGMVLICQIAGGPATAATVTVTGTNLFGEAYSETIVPSDVINATFYSVGVFASINASGIAWGAFGGAATLTVTAVFAWQNSGNPGDTLNTYAIEQFDGQANFVSPFCLVEEFSIEGGMEKEVKFMAKGHCQEAFPVGDLTNVSSQITPLVQSQDTAEAGWESVVWIDPITGTAGTTPNSDLRDWKVTFFTPFEPRYTSWGNPQPYRTWNRAWRKKRYVECELKFDETAGNASTLALELDAFRKRKKRQLRLTVRGVFLGNAAGTNYYKGWQFDLAGRYVEAVQRNISADQANGEVTLKLKCELDNSLGYAHKITWWTQYNTW